MAQKKKRKRDHNTITWHCPDNDLRRRLTKFAAGVQLSRSKMLTLLVAKALPKFESGETELLSIAKASDAE